MQVPKRYPHAPSIYRQTFIDEEMVIRLDRDVYRCCHFINCKITFAGSDPDKNFIHTTQFDDSCQFDDCEITIIRLFVPYKGKTLIHGKQRVPMEGKIILGSIPGSFRNRPSCRLENDVMSLLSQNDGIQYQKYLMDIASKLAHRHVTDPAPRTR